MDTVLLKKRRFSLPAVARSAQPDTGYANRTLALQLYEIIEPHLTAVKIDGVQFYVCDGAVSLFGTVRNEEERALVLALVNTVSGVERISNHIKVIRPD